MGRLSPEKFKSMYCFGHTLQFVVNDAVEAFPEFRSVIKIVKVIVNHFHKSAKDSHELTEIQKKLNIKQHKLKNESPPRWNSLYYLMDRIVEQREAITVVLASNGKVNNQQNHEWKTAESYVKVLKPFENVTSMMSASRFPTLSMVIPVLGVLKQQMDESEMNDFGEQICENIKERWPDYESNLDLAIPALLNPRFKEYAFTNDEAKESAVQAVIDLMYGNSVGTVELESRISRLDNLPLKQLPQALKQPL
ncbi:zinc finger BED domain-containing 4-like [Paramuricea clavata]|uniref:Zinc finger BED domain-containing 4-like n=1 Tax=Paramuricea clavata TaxID=317549 RepID=A0A7D9DER5_PARCT|nr:zinc finger BED domain-containing 4-like [Paramuricea clavata]